MNSIKSEQRSDQNVTLLHYIIFLGRTHLLHMEVTIFSVNGTGSFSPSGTDNLVMAINFFLIPKSQKYKLVSTEITQWA